MREETKADVRIVTLFVFTNKEAHYPSGIASEVGA